MSVATGLVLLGLKLSMGLCCGNFLLLGLSFYSAERCWDNKNNAEELNKDENKREIGWFERKIVKYVLFHVVVV